jgi:hypothetical protein
MNSVNGKNEGQKKQKAMLTQKMELMKVQSDDTGNIK